MGLSNLLFVLTYELFFCGKLLIKLVNNLIHSDNISNDTKLTLNILPYFHQTFGTLVRRICLGLMMEKTAYISL